MLEIIFQDGARQGESIRLTFDKAWFGRQPNCDVVLQADGVSRAHFSIVRQGDDYVLIDNNSTNGTFVNGLRTTAVTLLPGYRISAGSITMLVRELSQAVESGFRFVAIRKGDEGSPQIISQATFRLGRKSICQLQLNDPEVAPIHAELEHGTEGVYITDLSGGAGVYVNGQRIVRQQLRHGDVVVIRPFEIRVVLTADKCLLSIRDRSHTLMAIPAALPGNYRDAVPAPSPQQHREAGEAKPSAAITAQPAWLQAKAPIWVPTSDILPNRFRSVLIILCMLGGLSWGGFGWMMKPQSFYSPGPMAKSHSAGNSKFINLLAADQKSSGCSACHAGFERVSAAKCQNCHLKVYKSLDEKPIEKHFLAHNQRGIGCATCHREHKGAQFALTRTGSETCQAAGCHVSIHRDETIVQASQKPIAPEIKALAVSFEANWVVGADNDVHPKHKEMRVKCNECHVGEKGGERYPVLPRKELRMKCLSCHGFGPAAAIQSRCYSCHFEHPTETPERFSPARFPNTPPPPAPMTLSGSPGHGALLFLSAIFAIPLLYFAGAAVTFRLEHRSFRTRTMAGLRNAPFPVLDEPAAPPAVSAPVSAVPKATDNQTPGGSLRPLIDLDLCVGCGTCVNVCPYNVLEMASEKAIAVRLGDCTGYSACAAECPTEAITLVRGGAMQTEELPAYDANLETNVPGLYMAGEVTGKALIKIAINQGKRVVDSILLKRPQPGEQYDVIVIGAGPAGVSTALAARSEGLKVLVLEQGTIANTIRSYSRQKFVMAEPVMIPVYGPLWMEDTSKESLLDRWQQIIDSTGLAINQDEKVLKVTRNDGRFLVQSIKAEYRGSRVVLAIGRRGSPRKLGVAGEDSAKVAYNLLDAEAYHGKAICVAGGGDSGIEAANGLARADLQNRVWLVHKGADFTKAKVRNQKKIHKSMEEARVKVLFNAGVVDIGERSLRVQTALGVEEIENDFVFVMVGGENPKKFLTGCGIEFSQRATS